MTEIAGQNDIANEVQAIARLFNDETAHSQINLVRIFGWGLLNPLEYSYYLDMELCAYDLHSQIRFAKEQREYIKAMVLTDATNSSHRYRRALSHVEYTVNILRDIMRGLRYLHSRELVHRDLKPANGTHTLLSSNNPSPPQKGSSLLSQLSFLDLRGGLRALISVGLTNHECFTLERRNVGNSPISASRHRVSQTSQYTLLLPAVRPDIEPPNFSRNIHIACPTRKRLISGVLALSYMH
jgi:hypothetical protein